MNVKELRVGNILTNNVETFQIKEKDLMFLLAFDNEHYAEPVAISPEWIRKFKFLIIDERRNKQSLKYFSIGRINGAVELYLVFAGNQLILSIRIDMQFVDLGTRIMYVHEFQNLYRALTGQERPIEM